MSKSEEQVMIPYAQKQKHIHAANVGGDYVNIYAWALMNMSAS